MRIAGGRFRIGETTYTYPSIQEAYDAMGSEMMQLLALEYDGDLTLDQGKTVTLAGGYGCDFSSNSGYSIISNTLTISTGKATLDRLIIR